MITKFVCGILLSATLLAATPASADVLVVYTGTVLFGSDNGPFRSWNRPFWLRIYCQLHI